MESTARRIAEDLLSIRAVFFRPDEPFTWASGIKSPVYCDNRLILTAPDVRTEVETALMQTIRREYPDAELCFLTGEDMFLTLETWYKPDVIYSLATICAAPRSTDGLKKLRVYAEKLARHGAKVILQHIDYLPVSSTMVREAVRQGRTIDALVPAKVARYIRENGLYH